MGYHRPVLIAFIALALPLIVLLMAVFTFGAEALGWTPATDALAQRGLLRTAPFPAQVQLGIWVLEAMALTGLFLLVRGRAGARWLDGLVTAAVAWVFRGPLMVLTLAQLTRLPREPFWSHTVHWAVLYGACGLALAALAGRLERRR